MKTMMATTVACKTCRQATKRSLPVRCALGVASLVVAMAVTGCETTDSRGNDLVGNTLIDIHHAITPAAINNQLMRGNYREANQLRAQDALFQLMRTNY